MGGLDLCPKLSLRRAKTPGWHQSAGTLRSTRLVHELRCRVRDTRLGGLQPQASQQLGNISPLKEKERLRCIRMTGTLRTRRGRSFPLGPQQSSSRLYRIVSGRGSEDDYGWVAPRYKEAHSDQEPATTEEATERPGSYLDKARERTDRRRRAGNGRRGGDNRNETSAYSAQEGAIRSPRIDNCRICGRSSEWPSTRERSRQLQGTERKGASRFDAGEAAANSQNTSDEGGTRQPTRETSRRQPLVC